MNSWAQHFRYQLQLRLNVDGAVGQDALRVLLAGRAAGQLSSAGMLLYGFVFGSLVT